MITITEVPDEPAVTIRGARLAWHPDVAASRIVSHPLALSLFLRWFCGSIMAAESVSADSAACTRTEGGGEGDESTAFFSKRHRTGEGDSGSRKGKRKRTHWISPALRYVY